MENNTKQPIDVYSLVNERIIDLLEAGTIPWRKPWSDGGMPHNIITKRSYRGINFMLLNSLDYPTNQYLTWKQLKETASGSVKRGEHGHVVVFSKRIADETSEDGTVTKSHSVLRYYKVFNVAQCVDIPKSFLEKQEGTEFEERKECTAILTGMKDAPKVQHKSQEAYYSPTLDVINLPKPKSFEIMEEYYATLFHELVHATGHSKRLNRKEIVENPPFGSDNYAIEELTAEIGGSYLCTLAGIEHKTIANSASYIQHWLTKLKDDKRFIMRAASRSQYAVDYILNDSSSISEEEMSTAEAVK